MAEEIILPETKDKETIYRSLLPQLKSLMSGEPDLVANLSNLAAALKEAFDFFWVGFYLVKDDELVLGPFQGPVACTRIQFGKGVCGSAWKEKSVIAVPNVDQFPGHIACNAASKSEIVVPMVVGEEVKLVLDVDSDKINDFDLTDEKYLLQVVNLLKAYF